MKRRFTSRIVPSASAVMAGLGTLLFSTSSVKAHKKATKVRTVQKDRLTGTYRLNPSIGDNVQELAGPLTVKPLRSTMKERPKKQRHALPLPANEPRLGRLWGAIIGAIAEAVKELL